MELYLAAHDARAFDTADVEIADERAGIPKLRMSFTGVALDTYSVNASAGIDSRLSSRSRSSLRR